MHRSGTSIVTNALSKVGLHVGEAIDLVSGNQFNETGYWELDDFVNLNARFLTALDLSYYDLSPFPNHWRDFLGIEALLGEAEVMLREHFGGKGPWGWKEPVTTVLMPVYNEVFRRMGLQPHYVICVRNPFDVAASLSRRDKLPEDQTLGLWLRYTLSALKESQAASRTVVFYDDLLASPTATVGNLLSSIGDPGLNGGAVALAASAVRKDLNHGDRPLEGLQALPLSFQQTFQLCREASRDPEGFQCGAYDVRIDELWSELNYWSNLFAEPHPPAGKLVVFWQNGPSQRSVERPFDAERKWQSIRIHVDAPPLATLGAGFFGLPSRYWVRKAVWKVRGKEIHAVMWPSLFAQLDEVRGTRRIYAFHGPEQLFLQTPPTPGPYEFEIEFMRESNSQVWLECVQRAAKELGPLRIQVAEMERQAGRAKIW